MVERGHLADVMVALVEFPATSGKFLRPGELFSICVKISRHIQSSYAGLTRVSILLEEGDHRVKPGDDGWRGGRPRCTLYARVPVNGKLPIGPMPMSPEMLSPATLPVNSRVSGIGLVMETFQNTSSPLAVPSKISAELPSA